MSDYYLFRNNQPDGPHSLDRLREMRARGEVTDDTPCCPNGASAWGSVGAILGPAVAAGQPPQLPPPLPPAMPPRLQQQPHPGLNPVRPGSGLPPTDFAHQFANKSAEVGSLASLFARRILASNFTHEAASEDERKVLMQASTPIELPIAQNYAAWRRAILWFSGVGLAVAALFQVVPVARKLFDDQNPYLSLKVAALALFGFQVLAPLLALWGAWRWSEIKESRRFARQAYFCQLLGPMLVFCVPVASIAGGTPQEVNGLRTFIIVWSLQILFPKIFALFPGMIRACLTLRTLLPESLMPGWICMFVAPLYALFCILAVIIGAQSGSVYLFAGFTALLFVPILVILDAKNLCAPADEATMNATLEPLRMRILIAMAICVVLLLIGGYSFLKELNIGFSNVVDIIATLIGNIFLLTLVASDFLTGVIRKAFEQDAELDDSPLYHTLSERMSQLANVKMADVTAGESMVVRNVGNLVRRARGD